jgi:FkbM family methyltransferase
VKRALRRGVNWSVARRDPDRATLADLRSCYQLLLGRAPDAHGWRAYAARVRDGVDREELAVEFMSSVEFKDRLVRTLAWDQGSLAPVAMSEGFTIHVRADDPLIGRAMRETHQYEPHVTARLKGLLTPGATFVDVGASVGFFTILASRLVGPTGRVVAFEPGSQNTSLLLLNVQTNNADNVEVLQVAASSEPGLLLYSRSGGNGHAAAFDGNAGALAFSDLVRADTLDRVLADEKRVDVVKVDVEGAEGLVLRGARRLLEQRRPSVIFEFSPPSLAATSGEPAERVLGLLTDLGYGLEILGDGEGAGRSRGVAEVIDHFRDSQAEHLDLLAEPLQSV